MEDKGNGNLEHNLGLEHHSLGSYGHIRHLRALWKLIGASSLVAGKYDLKLLYSCAYQLDLLTT